MNLFNWSVWIHRADSRLASIQCEMPLQSNTISHWLGVNLESAPNTYKKLRVVIMLTFPLLAALEVTFWHPLGPPMKTATNDDKVDIIMTLLILSDDKVGIMATVRLQHGNCNVKQWAPFEFSKDIPYLLLCVSYGASCENLENIYWLFKDYYHHVNKMSIPGCTRIYHFNTIWWSQWWMFCQNYDVHIPVLY